MTDENAHTPGSRGTILVMDDEETIRDVLGAMLAVRDFQAVFAANGAEAVELYRRAHESGHTFSAVIVDLTIPGGMGGEETARRLREIDPHVKAIVSSGHAQDPILVEYDRYGFSGVLTKPFRLAELDDVLTRSLESHPESC